MRFFAPILVNLFLVLGYLDTNVCFIFVLFFLVILLCNQKRFSFWLRYMQIIFFSSYHDPKIAPCIIFVFVLNFMIVWLIENCTCFCKRKFS